MLVVGGDEDRLVGEAVEVGGIGATSLDDGVHRVLGADPREIATAPGEFRDPSAHLLEVRGAFQRDGILVESEQEVVVAVDDAWCQQSTAGIDPPRGRWCVNGRAHVGDPTLMDTDRLGPGQGGVEGAHSGIGDQGVHRSHFLVVADLEQQQMGAGARAQVAEVIGKPAAMMPTAIPRLNHWFGSITPTTKMARMASRATAGGMGHHGIR